MLRLNNLVTELVKTGQCDGKVEFDNPRSGWVLFLVETERGEDGRISVTLDSAELVMKRRGNEFHAIRFLERGRHALHLASSGGCPARSLSIRTIPEVIYANYPSRPNFESFGSYDWEFLNRIGMLDAVNVLITGDPGDWTCEWVREGKRVIQQVAVPGIRKDDPQTAESIHDYWSGSRGWTHPCSSGLIADEFLTSRCEMYPVWVEAIERLVTGGERFFYPYLGGDPVALRPFLEPLMGLPCRFADEVYLREQPTKEGAEGLIEERLVRHVRDMEERVPGITSRLVLVLGFLSGPPETLNADPSVNYKVFMDMQFHRIATDPAFKDLWGIEEYLSSYADEEYLRWAARLFRHYCLDGRTDRVTSDSYLLDHIRNPDFTGGLEGWEVREAEPGSTGTRREEGYGWLEGRYPRSTEGEYFFWMRRSSRGPNTLSQPIRGLEPGRAHSVKMYVGDGSDLTNPEIDPISIEVSGSEFIEEYSFQGSFPNCYSHHIDRYGDTRTYFNYMRRVFRPENESAVLSISDWSDERGPGSRPGQVLILNFVEVEPFYTG